MLYNDETFIDFPLDISSVPTMVQFIRPWNMDYGLIKWTINSGQNRPISYWSVIFSIPVLQLIVLETGNVLMGHPN